MTAAKPHPSLFDDAPLPKPKKSLPATPAWRAKAESVVENVEWLVSWGTPFHEIARRLGKTVAALERSLYRYGRDDLARLSHGGAR